MSDPDPWPHQQLAIDQFWAAVNSGKRRICLSSPTGGGKTFISSLLIKGALTRQAESRGWNVAFSVNRKSLAEQTRVSFEKYGLNPGMRASGYDTSFENELQISMTPTECVRALGKNPSWGLHNADLVFFDEAHNEKSARSLKLIEEYERNNPNVIFCGLTATPLDIGHIYDTLIVAGTNSELRECGAHLLCKEFCPTMPDLMKMKRNADGEFSEKTVTSAMKPEIVFGHILPHYRRLNPLMRPTIVFAPSVKGSITITDMFLKAGIPSAHIDAKHIYYGEKDADGRAVMEDSMKIANREKLFDEVRTGEIKVISSRFLLTEGIDLPQVGHLIFATSYGSLKMYLQAGGRLLRAHDSLNTVTCIARDSDVLTDRGLVKIQDVKLSDKVWDGVEFVSHDGAICKGVQNVIEWDGVTATPEHEVYTNHGWETIKGAKAGQRGITTTGSGRVPIRLPENIGKDNKGIWAEVRSGSLLREMWRAVVQEIPSTGKKKAEGLLALHEQIRGSLPGMDLAASAASEAQMHKTGRYWIPSLRWKGCRIPILVGLRGCLLGSQESRDPEQSKNELGQDRQRRALRARKPEMGNVCRAEQEQENDNPKKKAVGDSSECLSSSLVCSKIHRETIQEKYEPKSNSGSMGEEARTAEVWDIVNCGPRNRFTVNGKLVHNCQDHGGNCLVHGSLNDDRIWDLGDSSKSLLEKTLKDRKDGKSQEPIICPKCGAMRLSGPSCHECGHKGSNSGINILQQDGTLRQMKGPYITRKANTTSDAVKAWNNIYFPSSKSRSSKSMTFKQALSRYKLQNKHLTVFNTVDPKGRERVAAAEDSGKVSFLPMMPPVGNEYLWSQKVRDVPKKDLL